MNRQTTTKSTEGRFRSIPPVTIGELEHLAGVTDRGAFWSAFTGAGSGESILNAGGAALVAMIAERAKHGVVTLCYRSGPSSHAPIAAAAEEDELERARRRAPIAYTCNGGRP